MSWVGNFDRRISLAVVDYANIALGLGRIKVALFSVWMDSASLARQVYAQQKMGLVLTPSKVQGKGVDETLIVGTKFIMQVLQAQKLNHVRYVDAWVGVCSNTQQESLIVVKGQFESKKEQKLFASNLPNDIARIVHTLGVGHFAISGPQWVETPTAQWNGNPLLMEDWEAFMGHMGLHSQIRKME